MSVYVRYEFDKMFKSTTKNYDNWTMTSLIGDCNLRLIRENGYEMVEKNKHFLAFVKPNIPPDRKNTKDF